MKLTPWFPGTVKPVRKGVYERDASVGKPYYSYWNGKFWGAMNHTPSDARLNMHRKSAFRNLPWRGVEK